jgi:hypothetical protein
MWQIPPETPCICESDNFREEDLENEMKSVKAICSDMNMDLE